MKSFFRPFYRSIFSIFIASFFFFACDDGEIVLKDFDFEAIPLQTCGPAGNYVFYKVNNTSFESLSLKFANGVYLYPEPHTSSFPLNNSTIYVNYRRYDGRVENNYFCNSVPPSSPKIIDEYTAVSGEVIFEVTFREEENKLYKDVHLILKDVLLNKEKEQIILQTLDFGKIEGVETIDL